MVIQPGMHREFILGVGGAQLISATLIASPQIAQYVTLDDPAPKQGPRQVKVIIDIPDNAVIPPSVYDVTFSANEIPQSVAQVSTSVSISLGFTLRRYSPDPVLEITGVDLQPVPKGQKTNFTVHLISRSLVQIPLAHAKVTILDENGSTLVQGVGLVGPINTGEAVTAEGTLDTSQLEGGIYRSNAVVTYGPNTTSYNRSILRVGTLTIDLADYTKTLTFNQTNKFTFSLASNWNRPLTRVSATVKLLGQSKRSPEVSIPAFGTSDPQEVYFDRTELPPGQQDGAITINYEEKNPNPALQDTMEVHEFTIPIHVDIVLPPQPAKTTSRWHVTSKQVFIALIILLVLINVVAIVLLLRKRKQQ